MKAGRKVQLAVGRMSLGLWERVGLRVSLWESSLGNILKASVLEEAKQSRPRVSPLSV